MLHASNPHPQVGHGDWAARYITRLLFKLTPQDVVFAFLSFLGQGVWSDSFLSFLGQGVWSDSFLSLLGQGVWSNRVGRCMLTCDEPLVPSSIQKAPRREEAEHPVRNGLACGEHGIPQCVQISCIACPNAVINSNIAPTCFSRRLSEPENMVPSVDCVSVAAYQPAHATHGSHEILEYMHLFERISLLPIRPKAVCVGS